MTAREMFERLGYRPNYNFKDCIRYDPKGDDDEVCKYFIFNIKERTVAVGELYKSAFATMDEFKAIQQQMRELGWI